MSFSGFYEYTSVEELKRRAKLAFEKNSENGETLSPVIINGTKIASSWWGKAWCTNLEKYADYSNRIGRGKSYVKSGCVIDLQITSGEAAALVQGSRSKPYKTNISIDALSSDDYNRIVGSCLSKIQNLDDLVRGSFPDDLKTLFTENGGLFPTMKQIHFDCSCPDWAYMCKHVAAVLYGIGARLDDNPLLFFTLRSIDIDHFISNVIHNRIEEMIHNASKPSSRIIADDEVGGMFGFDL